jgi:hypothetical protein
MGAGASASLKSIVSAELDLTVVAGRDLIGKDGGMFSKATSDPFVKVTVGGMDAGNTDVVKKSLSPEWNAKICAGLSIGPKALKAPIITLGIFDYDACSASDPMGVVTLPLEQLLNGAFEGWLPVQPCDGCRKTKGELNVVASLAPRQALVLATGASLAVAAGPVMVGLGWDMLPGGRAVDVDTSCVAVSAAGRVLLDESVYYADLINSNGAIRHTGDEKEGDADLNASGDDEIILIDLARVPSKVCGCAPSGAKGTRSATSPAHPPLHTRRAPHGARALRDLGGAMRRRGGRGAHPPPGASERSSVMPSHPTIAWRHHRPLLYCAPPSSRALRVRKVAALFIIGTVATEGYTFGQLKVCSVWRHQDANPHHAFYDNPRSLRARACSRRACGS